MSERNDRGRSDRPECDDPDCSNEATTLYELSGATKDELVRCDDCEPFWIGPGAPSIENRIDLVSGEE